MNNNKKPFIPYRSMPSDDVDINKCAIVKAYFFPNGTVEAKAISYQRHFRTIKEIQNEIDYITSKYNDVNIKLNNGLTVKEKLLKLEKELAGRRRKKYAPSTKKSKIKLDNIISLRRSQKNLILLLKTRFSIPFLLCSTLMYEKKEYNYRNVVEDFKKTKAKIKYRYPKFKYVAIYELHQDTSWHIHLIWTGAKLDKKLLETLWGQGYVHIQEFDIRSFPYFCKSDRLKYYPSGARLYNSNMKVPNPQEIHIEEFKRCIKGLKCISSSAKTLYKGDQRVNHFIYLKYEK